MSKRRTVSTLAAVVAAGAVVGVLVLNREGKSQPRVPGGHSTPVSSTETTGDAPDDVPPPNAIRTAPTTTGAVPDAVREHHRSRLKQLRAALATTSASPAKPTRRPAPGAQSAPPVLATQPLDRDYLADRIRDLTPLFAECYQMALEREPELEGTATIEFAIIGDDELGGLVEYSELDPEASSITSPQLAECIRETVYGLELVAPPGGGRTVVRYPMAFSRGEPEPDESTDRP